MNEMQHIQEQFKQIDSKLNSITVLLKGHEFDKNDNGMVGQLNEQNDRIDKLEKLVDKGKWFLYGLAVPASWGVIDIIQKIVIK
ncbi:MAG: hypothetical protein J7527_05835 [Chitinophagaceae bacterium]|nr:hypothetical protein [Chitinophagaceae bacterium]